jgi:hypothetical protein
MMVVMYSPNIVDQIKRLLADQPEAPAWSLLAFSGA